MSSLVLKIFFRKGKNSIEKDNENFWRHPFAKRIYWILIILWKTSHMFCLFVGFLVLILAGVHRAKLVGFIHIYIFFIIHFFAETLVRIGCSFWDFPKLFPVFSVWPPSLNEVSFLQWQRWALQGFSEKMMKEYPQMKWCSLILVKAVTLHSPSIDRSTDRQVEMVFSRCYSQSGKTGVQFHKSQLQKLQRY